MSDGAVVALLFLGTVVLAVGFLVLIRHIGDHWTEEGSDE